MRKTRKDSSLWAYLNERGVLERGDPQEIRQAKKEYRKLYMKRYKATYKRKKKDFAISCNAQEREQLISAAKKHGLKPATFLKKAVFAYSNTTYLVPEQAGINHILQVLLRYETTIRRLESKDKGAWYKPDRNYKELEQVINEIRISVEGNFVRPPSLETAIVKALHLNPGFYKILQTILTEYDPHKHGA